MAGVRGAVEGWPKAILRLEGAAALAVAGALFRIEGGSWILFAALILLPDIALTAYLAGPKIGAIVYNAVHTTIGPLLLSAAGYASGRALIIQIGMVWLAHVGLDRLLGFGLKYADRFASTHLGILQATK